MLKWLAKKLLPLILPLLLEELERWLKLHIAYSVSPESTADELLNVVRNVRKVYIRGADDNAKA